MNSLSDSRAATMSKAHILVVEDEEDIRELIRYNLSREGYRVTCAETGEQGMEEIRSVSPDLILLDLMLPGADGLDVCRMLKGNPETSHLPVIMLTARTDDADVVSGLECGADDYITKPFSPRVLQARIKAALRRARPVLNHDDSALHFGSLAIYPARHEVTVDLEPVDLTVTEFRILLTLARRPGWVFSRDRIVDTSRGGNVTVTPRTIDVHMVRLRSKLGRCGRCLESVRGLGYRFRPLSDISDSI